MIFSRIFLSPGESCFWGGSARIVCGGAREGVKWKMHQKCCNFELSAVRANRDFSRIFLCGYLQNVASIQPRASPVKFRNNNFRLPTIQQFKVCNVFLHVQFLNVFTRTVFTRTTTTSRLEEKPRFWETTRLWEKMVFRENWFPELRELGRQDFSVLRQNTP